MYTLHRHVIIFIYVCGIWGQKVKDDASSFFKFFHFEYLRIPFHFNEQSVHDLGKRQLKFQVILHIYLEAICN